jgi:hypothetical protein
MKLGSLAGARAQYYDRNAIGGRTRFFSTVGPHALTTRWTVTVASGRKSLIEVGRVAITTSTLPTVLGFAGAGIDTNDGTTACTITSVNIATSTTTVLTTSDKSVNGITLYAGYTAVGQTSDSSTGGTIIYVVDLTHTTFDA